MPAENYSKTRRTRCVISFMSISTRKFEFNAPEWCEIFVKSKKKNEVLIPIIHTNKIIGISPHNIIGCYSGYVR